MKEEWNKYGYNAETPVYGNGGIIMLKEEGRGDPGICRWNLENEREREWNNFRCCNWELTNANCFGLLMHIIDLEVNHNDTISIYACHP